MKRVLIDSPEEPKHHLGCIQKSTVIGMCGMLYTLEIETDQERHWIVETGGDAEPFEAFHYNPNSTDWASHVRVGICKVERKKKLSDTIR